MMDSLRHSERGRTTPAISPVAAGDFLLLLTFAFIGRVSHHELSAGGLWGIVGTAAPFLVGWGMTAPLLGAYAPDAFRSYHPALARILAAWPVALFLALVIRSVVDREVPALAFVLVALVFNLITLGLWRALVVSRWRGRP